VSSILTGGMLLFFLLFLWVECWMGGGGETLLSLDMIGNGLSGSRCIHIDP
jgi:hypothetical protein